MTIDAVDGLGTDCQPLPSFQASSSRGVTRLPPFATVAIITASDSGVTDTCPWPIATEIVSPGYHRSPVAAFFQARDGIRPCTSYGRSIPLSSPSPSAVDHLWI